MANESENTKVEKTEAAGKSEKAKPAVKKKKKLKRNVSEGVAYIRATFNNTLITICDTKGDVVSWSSSGARGFKGSKKSTPFAAQIAGEDAGRKAVEMGMRTVRVSVIGPGSGRETALKALGIAGLRITHIQDMTPIPHNGCRPAKKRRV